MKSYIAILQFLFFSTKLFAQLNISSDTVILNLGESYIVQVEFQDKILENKCYCISSNEECALWSIKMIKCYYIPKNKMLDSSSILMVKFSTIPQNYFDSIIPHKKYTVSMIPSASYKYLTVKRIMNTPIDNYTVFMYKGPGMYFGDKFNCKKKRPWPNRLFYSKKNKYIIFKDPFEEAIQKNELK